MCQSCQQAFYPAQAFLPEYLLQKKTKAHCGVNLFFAGELFAQAPVEQYPGCVVEAVTDSSRYFVIRIEDGNGKMRSSQLYELKSEF